jgi:aspartyl-tRNA(Asn)/glutamyl-tRNA(Gln) amidotransferase subunit A
VETIRELAPDIKAGRLSSVKLAEKFLDRISRLNPALNAFITILKDSALAQAERADKMVSEGRYLGPLHGIPFAIKDIIYIEGVRSSAGSRILSSNIATYDAPVVAKLKEAGATIVGTTNLHEFASGVTSNNPFFGPVRNPWDRERIPGGSSGGSAAAVAADMAVAALGTDTSGSIRIPAALCGVVGLKPTYGLVSRRGVIPLAPSFDTVGPIAHTAWDAAATLTAISGQDVQDHTSLNALHLDYEAAAEAPLEVKKVVVPRRYFQDVLAKEVEEEFLQFTERLHTLGVETIDSPVRDMDKVYGVWAPIRRGEAAAFHQQWFPQMAGEYGDDVRRALEKGMEVKAVEYINAQNARPEIRENFLRAMEGADLMVTPAEPVVAPKIGEESVEVGGKPYDVYSLLGRLTLPSNVTGFPTMSFPIGLVEGLPVGAQIIGRPLDERKILNLCGALESRFGPFKGPPNL